MTFFFYYLSNPSSKPEGISPADFALDIFYLYPFINSTVFALNVLSEESYFI